ncbi:hypothetical protein OYC64_014831 [Pagothenia borchgrevinki]
MEPKSSPTHLNGRYDFGNGGAAVTEHLTSRQRYNNNGRNKSKVRLNDQLIPKPTDINVAEKMIKIAIPKSHPYSSHISKFAMFPSYRCPDDPETGVRAASQPFLNPLMPNSAPGVTLLSKAIGSSYRHEILETPIRTTKKAVMWTGEHGFLDHSKPLKGENQVFYPTPPKTVLPNPKLRTLDLSISERTSNMLKNLERTHWVTSYQMHHTGSGPANPLKIDDFQEKICDITGMNSHNAPLRERSFPVFVPSKPRGGCRRREATTCSTAAAAAERTNLSSAPNQGTGRPQEITARYNEATDPNQKGHNQSKYSSGSTKAWRPEPSQEVSPEQQNDGKLCLYKGEERGDCMSREASEQEKLPCSLSKSRIRPRPPVLPGSRPVDRSLCLLDLQNSFSKTKAHHNFNNSVTRAAVNLRDNVHTGKKHDLYGINCYYLHG